MTGLRLSIRSAAFYWRSHLSVAVGTAVAGAVLVGAMLVGDSVKYSLKESALLRLGRIHHALSTQDRFFRQDLADRLEHDLRITAAPLLLLRGIAMTDDDSGKESRQVNNIQVIGIDDRFSWFAGGDVKTPGEDEIAVNAKLAAALSIKTGDRLSIRIGKTSLLPRDAPLSSRTGDDTSHGTFTVSQIVTDKELGRFSLEANQVVPCNVFVNLRWLQQAAGVQGRANLLLAAGAETLSSAALDESIRKVWQIEDAGLALRQFSGLNLLQLESDRVFMDPGISSAALGATDDKARNEAKPTGSLTYLVNSISTRGASGMRATPYSFVEALSPSANRKLGPVPLDMTDDEIIANRWLASRLSISTGDTVEVAYYELTQANKFVEKHRSFRIRGVLEMDDIASEKELCPKFPGLTDVDRCAEWDIGMPLEKDKIEDKENEAYWQTYRATPKAFITLKAGQAMWANRFGNMSAVRYPAEFSDQDLIAERLRQRLDPASIGLRFTPVRAQALKAVNEAMDFGQLFIGMSLFLIVAGLMLTGLLFAFGIQQRSTEMGALLAVGYRPRHVQLLLMQESCLTAGLGSLAGVFLGTLYTRALIWGLGNSWQGAVANSAIQYHAEPLTALKGAIACFVCAIVAMAIAMWRQSVRPARDLLSGEFLLSAGTETVIRRGMGIILVLSWAGVAVAACVIGAAIMGGMHNAVPAFFVAGSLLLISGLGLIRQLLLRLDHAGARLTVPWLGVRNAGRRRARTLTAAGVLACGTFLVLAVSSMQEDVGTGAVKRSSGTGGFALFGESTLPVQGDLNRAAARTKFRLDGEPSLERVDIVALKVRDGDDASCLNLNRAQFPRLLGVDPEAFAKRHAFVQGNTGETMWDQLNRKLPGGAIPGLVGDKNTAMWGLEKKIGPEDGDELVYRDERGEPFKVRLVGSLPMRLSVLQGSILIQDAAFAAKYPSESGYRMFLVDVPATSAIVVKDVLSRRLSKLGLNLMSTVERLKEFNAVESTYMAMFLVLGGLGLLLGSAGMGIVVMRNIMERRGELGLLKAVGYSNAQLRVVLLTEHGLILAMGLVLGVASSVAAMWPSLFAPGVRLPYATMLLLIGGIAVCNLAWIAATVHIALRDPPLNALRNE